MVQRFSFQVIPPCLSGPVKSSSVEGGGYLIVENTGANKVTIADNETKVVTVTMPDGNASITIK